MDIEFGESTYAFNFLYTLCQSPFGGFDAAPIFPTLRFEGRENGAYDVEIKFHGLPHLFQFKRPCVLIRNTHKRPPRFGLPYYRMYLEPNDRYIQHRRLLQHQRNGKIVYYASPWFNTTADLDELYRVNQVWFQSLIIEPLDIGDLDYSEPEHYVAYEAYAPGISIRSEPKQVEGPFNGDTFLSRLRERIREPILPEQSLEITSAALNSLYNIIFAALSRIRTREIDILIERLGTYQAYALLARQFLDCQLVMINRRV